jgi:hypothetical protein
MKITLLIILAILAAVIVLTVLVAAFNTYRFNRKVAGEIDAIFASQPQGDGEILTDAEIESLPPPVQKHLRYSGAVGRPKMTSARVQQTGRIRTAPEQPWMEFTAEEYYTTDPPQFLWHAKANLFGIPLPIRDRLYQGEGEILGKVAATIPVAVGSGPEMTQGSMLRYLNEVMFFPSAFVSGFITWEAIDETSARSILRHDGLQVSAVWYFDDEGRIVNMVAERYYSHPDGSYSMETWETPITDYAEFDGIRIPSTGVGTWKLYSGDFTYVEIEIQEIEYNDPQRFGK